MGRGEFSVLEGIPSYCESLNAGQESNYRKDKQEVHRWEVHKAMSTLETVDVRMLFFETRLA
jgi:hypothetical protein